MRLKENENDILLTSLNVGGAMIIICVGDSSERTHL